ncbi:hypothetical protein ACFYXQ_22705 [Nocardia jiangxiensis]|uniref:Uncharacterized protein n=2 Tax=Nocardia jiangxiensis TaxID=282685 RepID=A0ABW6S2S6_9NOCA
MHPKAGKELRRDFERWVELIDLTGHAENEVEREMLTLRAADLEKKWVRGAAEDWMALRALHRQW